MNRLRAGFAPLLLASILWSGTAGAQAGARPPAPAPAVAAQALGVIWYVDNQATGDDSGNSWRNAWRSLSSIDWSRVNPGDTVYISGGTGSKIYDEGIEFTRNGSSGSPITIDSGANSPNPSGHDGEVIIDGASYCIRANGDYNVLRNLTCQNATMSGFRIQGTASVVEGCTVRNTYQQGIHVHYCTNCIVRGNRITTHEDIAQQTDGITVYDSSGTVVEGNWIKITNQNNCTSCHNDGIQANFSTAAYSDITIRYNYVENTKAATANAQGIYLTEMQGDVKIVGNVVHVPVGGQAVTSYLPNSLPVNVAVVGNTVINGGYWALHVGDDDPVIKNNILWQTCGSSLYIANGSLIKLESEWAGVPANIDHNLYWRACTSGTAFYGPGGMTWSAWQARGFDPNSIFGQDPLLDSCYRPTATSPLIGKGAVLGSEYASGLPMSRCGTSGSDTYLPMLLIGRGTSGWDIGAYEFASPASTFADVPFDHPYYDEIEWLYQNGYTAGCSTSPLMYCPETTMNRAESAVFVERGIYAASYDPPAPSSQVFADVPLDSWAAKWVNGLWQDQYTAGCGTNPLMYCPWQGHTRAEGAVFYLRMLHGANYEPAQPGQQTFVDVPLDTWYARWVQGAYDAGLITACQSSPQLRFCPDGPLSRGIAAYMMYQAKSKPAPTPTAPPPTATPVPPTPTPAAGKSYYVSKTGNNRDGLSWATAWNELDRIQWSLIGPGDTIFIDGGATGCNYPVMVTNSSNEPGPAGCGMTYTTTLTIGASGTAAAPITIQMSDEPGRNGTARIFGGRATPLGYCGQTGYVLGSANDAGIYLSGRSHIVVDGRKWGGIKIYGHNRTAIQLYHWGVQTDLTFRNIEVFDNGTFSGTSPDGPGINPVGTYLIFDRMIVHDNGQDAFQTCYVGELSNVTIQRSWLFNQRPHPNKPGDVFNECTHSDGLQYCSAATSTDLVVEDSIVGPGFMQGFILGYFATDRASKIINVTLRNSLLVSHHGESSNAGLIVPSVEYAPNNIPSGYVLDHITVVRDVNTCEEQGQPAANCPSATWESIGLFGSGHSVTNSVFFGGTHVHVTDSPRVSNNYFWRVVDYGNIATEADPMFVDADFDGVSGDPTSADIRFADFDFTITNSLIPAGIGSSIRSLADLFGQTGASPPVAFLGTDSWIYPSDARP